MDFFKKNKGMVLGGVGIFLAGILVYFLFFRSTIPPESADLLSGSAVGSGVSLDPRLLSALSQLKLVKLDQTIFKSAVFKSLKDFTVEIEPQPFGRPNPFAPLGDIEDLGDDDFDFEL